MEDPYTNYKQSTTMEPRKYDPYKDLQIQSILNPQQIYNLPITPEHLFEQEALKTRRNFHESLVFWTGVSVLGGSVFGGVKGTLEGLKAAERGESMKVRASRVMSCGGYQGRRFGNAAGVLGLFYGGLESGIAIYREKDDFVGSVLAGFGTGSLFRVFNGFRSTLIGGVLGGVLGGAVVAAAVAGKDLAKRYVPAAAAL